MNSGDFKELTVWQVNEYIRMVFENDPILTRISVKGEISNFKFYPSSGHMYFSLKDEQAVIKAVMFKSSAVNLGFMPKNGMKVTVVGKISSYPRDGVYQIYVSSMKEDGEGSLFEALERLKKKLSAMGLFDPAHKRPLPVYPRTIGIVTSLKAAALRDMLNILKRRNPGVEVIIYPSAVQGKGAWRELVSGIEYFSERGNVDAVIIGRGGGAYEDLWEFNNENLAIAIYNSSVPVISAVGHETDFTICDFVADMRAPTPSAAAELAVPTVEEIKASLSKWKERCGDILSSRLLHTGTVLDGYEKRCTRDAMYYLTEKQTQIDAKCQRLGHTINTSLEKKEMQMISSARSLEALNPLSVLSRGFGYVTDLESGQNISRACQTEVGKDLRIRFSDGSVKVRTEEIEYE